MRALTTAAAAALDAPGVRAALVMVAESWLGSVSLGRVPVVAGSWSVVEDESQQVPGRVTFDVPAKAKWVPVTVDHPLANYGQQLRIQVGIRLAGGGTEWVNEGRLRILSAIPVDDVVQVTAASLEQLVEWDRLTAPIRVTGPTRADGLSTLLTGVLPFVVRTTNDPAMGPLSVDRDRLQGVRDLLDAWPARSFVDESGTLIVEDAWGDTVPAAVWSTEGRLRSTSPVDSDADHFNGYVVTTVPEDGVTVPVSEVWVMPSGPMKWGPPYGRRPGFFESPTLPADRSTLQNVAKNLTLRAVRRGRNVQVVTLPDPRIVRGDVVHVVDHAKQLDMVGRVVSRNLSRLQLELTVSEGL